MSEFKPGEIKQKIVDYITVKEKKIIVFEPSVLPPA